MAGPADAGGLWPAAHPTSTSRKRENRPSTTKLLEFMPDNAWDFGLRRSDPGLASRGRGSPLRRECEPTKTSDLIAAAGGAPARAVSLSHTRCSALSLSGGIFPRAITTAIDCTWATSAPSAGCGRRRRARQGPNRPEKYFLPEGEGITEVSAWHTPEGWG